MRLRKLFASLVRYHFFGSFAIVLLVVIAIGGQITDRRQFASSKLHKDVMERWGAPIEQPVPSVRYVESGTVFNTLKAMPFEAQTLSVDATMNYRKRGLTYFSGFDFAFRGQYRVKNTQGKDLDMVFVFPINIEKNKVLLSDFEFLVNEHPTPIDLSERSDKLVWTGRLTQNAEQKFEIRFKGRGLDAFSYRLDPNLPVRNLKFDFTIQGGDNYDYAHGVVPAQSVVPQENGVRLTWRYDALESGVPMGVILPSVKAVDNLIGTMVLRSWATFLLFFAGFVALSIYYERRPRIYESYLVAASYGFFFVLTAYLSAYTHFLVAYALSTLIIAGLLCLYMGSTMGGRSWRWALGLIAAFLTIPTAAVICEGYTGLIYTLEILAGLAALMLLTAKPKFKTTVDRVLSTGTGGALLLALSMLPQPASAQSSATLPLSEVIELHRAKAQKTEAPQPPILATLNKLHLTGRLLDDAVDLRVAAQVAVLSDGHWVKVPLLKVHEQSNVSALPKLPEGTDGVMLIDDGNLCFLTNKKGLYSLEFSMLERAARKSGQRLARIEYPKATSAELLLIHDEGLFNLATEGGLKEAEGIRLYPQGRSFSLRWSRRKDAKATPLVVERPPVDSIITSARSTVVSTLEGAQITRVRYDLRFEGTKPISVTIPDSTSVEKVYLNGVATPFKVQGEKLDLEVSPARAGDQSGKLEVLLRTPLKTFDLSGKLNFVVPQISWPINELFVDVYLPQVFNYTWQGGSLAPKTSDPDDSFTYKMPTPGTRLSFHQYLITNSSPNVSIRYTINLEGQYFGGRSSGGQRR